MLAIHADQPLLSATFSIQALCLGQIFEIFHLTCREFYRRFKQQTFQTPEMLVWLKRVVEDEILLSVSSVSDDLLGVGHELHFGIYIQLSCSR